MAGTISGVTMTIRFAVTQPGSRWITTSGVVFLHAYGLLFVLLHFLVLSEKEKGLEKNIAGAGLGIIAALGMIAILVVYFRRRIPTSKHESDDEVL